ncbi:hypothetical protein T07_12677 [Trichinella nelsoni]|uniref:Uncharacterized protein n=1 Tax=Trichinella nelsoni TaxID=6336 RepID=A0A0V0RR87_9BILA|nr:hypothetical protein T07_12677 [Trichinella nelsoni]
MLHQRISKFLNSFRVETIYFSCSIKLQVPLVCRNSLFEIQLTSDELRYIHTILEFSTANS